MIQEIIQEGFTLATDILKGDVLGSSLEAMANLVTITSGLYALKAAYQKGNDKPMLALE